MHHQGIQEGSDDLAHLDRAILGLVLDIDQQRPWSEAEITRAISTLDISPTVLSGCIRPGSSIGGTGS